MPYQRRRRASLAIALIRYETENDEGIQRIGKRSDDSDSDEDCNTTNSSDATFLQTDVAKHGRIPEILMDDLWSTDALIVLGAIRELADIGSYSDGEDDEDNDEGVRDRLWVFELGGPMIIISVMRKWNRYRKITIEGLRAMANLGANTGFRDAVFKHGGVEVALMAMKNFNEDEIIQRNGCACIRRFVWIRSRIQSSLSTASTGLRAVIRAMKRFPNNLRLQQFAIGTLFAFAYWSGCGTLLSPMDASPH